MSITSVVILLLYVRTHIVHTAVHTVHTAHTRHTRHTLWHNVFPERGSLFEHMPRRVVAHTANPTLGAELPGPVMGGPRLDTLEAILAELEVA